MDLEERQRRRRLDILNEAQAAIAEADKALAKAQRFMQNEGHILKARLDALPSNVREQIAQEARLAVKEIEAQAAMKVQRQFFDQQKYGYRPRSNRNLV